MKNGTVKLKWKKCIIQTVVNTYPICLSTGTDMFTEIPVFNANSEYPDQMLHSAASDLGLHCLPITLLGVSRPKWDMVS